ncbi:caspase-8-like [Mytilus trossulus]|uniref:caspase-8-like n=1 Tax=Mytilus trossulus TaxID=6551 RepID=UPI003003EEC8
MDRSRKKLSDRIGSDKDADILVNTWKNLGFKVSRYDDLTSAHMIEILEDAAKKDHSKYDCLVVCILSHGVLGHVYGSDGLSVEINHLKGFFSGSRSLVGKPKLFFVQACQGKKNQKGHAIETNAGVSMKKISQERQDLDVDGPTEVIPDEADFLLAHATAPGYVSYRKESGSSYIRILTNNLDQFADKLDLLTILTKVNKEVGQIEFKGGNKQISAPMYTLRKKVLFY